jgi:hypothetical protein
MFEGRPCRNIARRGRRFKRGPGANVRRISYVETAGSTTDPLPGHEAFLHATMTDIRWVEPAESPFRVRCVDCRPLSSTTVSTTRDVLMATSFHDLRRSSGERLRNTMPPDPITVHCALRYPYLKGWAEGPLYRASQMEEKWDLFLFDNTLYFARSWTGSLVFIASAALTGGRLLVESISADRAATGGNQVFIVRSVDFLIKSHLYHLAAPHPIPEGFPDDPDRIALYSFGEYGRMASFATYEDTLGTGLDEQ